MNAYEELQQAIVGLMQHCFSVHRIGGVPDYYTSSEDFCGNILSFCGTSNIWTSTAGPNSL